MGLRHCEESQDVARTFELGFLPYGDPRLRAGRVRCEGRDQVGLTDDVNSGSVHSMSPGWYHCVVVQSLPRRPGSLVEAVARCDGSLAPCDVFGNFPVVCALAHVTALLGRMSLNRYERMRQHRVFAH